MSAYIKKHVRLYKKTCPPIKKKEQLHLLTEHGKGATTTYDVGDPGSGLRPVLKCFCFCRLTAFFVVSKIIR